MTQALLMRWVGLRVGARRLLVLRRVVEHPQSILELHLELLPVEKSAESIRGEEKGREHVHQQHKGEATRRSRSERGRRGGPAGAQRIECNVSAANPRRRLHRAQSAARLLAWSFDRTFGSRMGVYAANSLPHSVRNFSPTLLSPAGMSVARIVYVSGATARVVSMDWSWSW